MNEEVMCGHPAEVLWTSCRGYVVRKVVYRATLAFKKIAEFGKACGNGFKMGKYFLPNVKNEKGGGGVKGVRSLAAYKTIYILL